MISEQTQQDFERDDSLVLAVRGLSKQFYLHAQEAVVRGFDSVSFDARPGKFFCLVGASGAGKSSVLRCIYRSYLPTAGETAFRTSAGVIVNLVTATDQIILDLRRGEIGIVSQFLRVLPRQTAKDVVAAPLVEAGVSVEEARERAAQSMSHVGVPERLWNLPPATFSGGERQLVNLSRALIVRPRLLLLDEPTASLDYVSSARVIDEIERLKTEQIALVGVFHDRRIVERLADDVLEMRGGVQWNDLVQS